MGGGFEMGAGQRMKPTWIPEDVNDPPPDPDRFRRLTAEYMETRFPELWEALERREDVDS